MIMRIIKVLLAVLCIVFFSACGSLRHAKSDRYIKVFDSSSDAHFTNQQLVNMMNQSPGYTPSVLVRNLTDNAQSSIASNTNTHQLCSMLEMGLAKNNFDVRDRALFESVLTNGIDYSQLYEKTHVDLLLEITGYDLNVPYVVDKYYVGDKSYFFPARKTIINGKKRSFVPVYRLRGMSVSIKVIILQENLIGGSYTFNYIPCAAEDGGGLITNLDPLRYRLIGSNRDVDAVIHDSSDDSRERSTGEKMDILMEKYLSDNVIPTMVSYMRGMEKPDIETSPIKDMESGEVSTAESERNNTLGAFGKLISTAAEKDKQTDDAFTLADMVGTGSGSVDLSLPIYSSSANMIQGYKRSLTTAGIYTDVEAENIIVEQQEKNHELLRSKGTYSKITSLLTKKEEIHRQMIGESDTKRINQFNKRLSELDEQLKRIGYVDFNDYSYVIGVDGSNKKERKSDPKTSSNHGDDESTKKTKAFQLKNMISSLARKDMKSDEGSAQSDKRATKEVRLVNSFGDLSGTVSDMIHLGYINQSKEELSKVKGSKVNSKQDELQSIESDLERLQYLNSQRRKEVNVFINTSSYAVGNECPKETSDIVFFLSSSERSIANDAILVFVDGVCVGTGTSANGFYSVIPSGLFSSDFHELKIAAIDEKTGNLYEIFSSSVMFDVKKEYNFISVSKSQKITELILN